MLGLVGSQSTTTGSDQEEHLWYASQYATLSADMVGLHPWTFSDLKRDRERRKESLWDGVLAKQDSIDTEALAMACRHVSRPSRHFALYLGRIIQNEPLEEC